MQKWVYAENEITVNLHNLIYNLENNPLSQYHALLLKHYLFLISQVFMNNKHTFMVEDIGKH